MTAGPSIDPARFLEEQLAQASPDLMRDLLATFVNALLSAQADAVCSATSAEADPSRSWRWGRARGPTPRFRRGRGCTRGSGPSCRV